MLSLEIQLFPFSLVINSRSLNLDFQDSSLLLCVLKNKQVQSEPVLKSCERPPSTIRKGSSISILEPLEKRANPSETILFASFGLVRWLLSVREGRERGTS